MKILVIDNKQGWWTPALDEMMQQRGIYAEHLSPTLLSAFTALKAGKLIDKLYASLVVASNLSDAAAGLSGCTIAKHKAKTVVMPQPSVAAPRGIPTAIVRGVAGWVFPSQRCLNSYHEELAMATVIGPVTHEPFAAPYADAASSMLWAGSIDGNSARLRRAIRLIDDSEQWSKLAIFGTGKAQEVMPAVRDSRAIAHPQKIEWLPQGTLLPDAALHASAVVQTASDASGLELAIAENGRQLLIPGEKEFEPVPPYPSTSQRADALAQFLHSLC